jgi:SAM-dependent methyltransferase
VNVVHTSMAISSAEGDHGFAFAGGVTAYRRRTFAMLRSLIASTGGAATAIDVGAGDGWMAKSLVATGLLGKCTPVDVKRRSHVVLEPLLYDGERLPFDDASVDLCYAVDAVHHAADPLRLLRDMARVSRRFIALKDHRYESAGGAWVLRLLDEIGNRRFAIGSPGHYQRGFTWFDLLRSEGFGLRTLIHPARCHVGMLGLTNRLQFLALFERNEIDGRSTSR